MLTAEQFDAILLPLSKLFADFEQTIILDIARRLGKMGRVTSTASWQMQRLSESGRLYESILSELSILTGKTRSELRKAFEQAGVRSLAFDDGVYRKAGFQPLPLNLSPAMAKVLAAGLIKTAGLIENLTLTTALAGQEAFVNAADIAYLQVTTGTMGYDQAIRAAVKKVAGDGLKVVDYAGGRREQLDVAMRRTILTGIGQTTAELQIMRADEMGQDLIAVSAHAGARNKGEGPENHESWQGKIYSRAGNPKYPDFVTVTGYGSVEGLAGINCRHSFFPFFEGISKNLYTAADLKELSSRTVKYQGKKTDQYSASQIQRHLERSIRSWKRQAGALEAAGLSNDKELAKVREYQGMMRTFVKETGLMRQRNRELI
jgi:hypothetical protein